MRVERPPFSGRRIVLGVTGGIAAFKSIGLARELTLAGSAVDVVPTAAAFEFVRPLSFEALTGRSVLSDLYAPGDPLLHIRLAREADLVLIAPATANFIAQAAAGMADHLLGCILLATKAPVLFAPAMNDRMYTHPQTQANLARLQEIGYHVAGPAEGLLAFGERAGPGRMIEPDELMEWAARSLTGETPLSGKRVIVTAGPTREPIDPVRFLGNRSSGRMGFSLASAAWRMGADVLLVSGPSPLRTPAGVRRIEIETAIEMADAVRRHLNRSDVLIMAAAVADFRPVSTRDQKIKKQGDSIPEIVLEHTPDVLGSTMSLRKPGAVVVGFALETENPIENATKKLRDKRLDLLVVNDAGEPGAGFEVPTNRVTLLHASGQREDLPLLSKDEVAERILERVAQRLVAGE
ncbi:MAG: bifunctional phosphopantothenoylcysteine decarboxylase/phosphopantothenate--cysteine ligase CoaBC [Gemmatimonas sp.]|nr:bifunctional phosphopantothenoylcysteine decarboxylase/phosphopantothenate--cysteine ligase CoaBC [Gemmatimonas sp.]